MYVTVGGVEGSGHHLFASALHGAFDNSKDAFDEASSVGEVLPLHEYDQKPQQRGRNKEAPRTYFVNEVHSQMWPPGRHRDIETGISEPLELLAQMRKNPKAYGPLFDPKALSSALRAKKNKAAAAAHTGEGGVNGGSGVPAAAAAALLPLTKERVRLFNGGGSHPFGQPRSPYRFADLVATEQLHSQHHLLDVRAVFFYRNATDAVLSVLRRGFASEVELQARVAELDLAYLDGVLRLWPCRRHLLLSYEFAIEQPHAAAAMIAALLDDGGGGRSSGTDSVLASSIGRSMAGVLSAHVAAAARAKANPDATAGRMAEEMAAGRNRDGAKIFHGKQHNERAGRRRARETVSTISGGGSGGDDDDHGGRQHQQQLGIDGGNASVRLLQEAETTNSVGGKRRRGWEKGGTRGSTVANSPTGGELVEPERKRKEVEGSEGDPKAHRYYPLFEMKWCRARRDSVASTPSACYDAMRGFLDAFFVPRAKLFQSLAGISSYGP